MVQATDLENFHDPSSRDEAGGGEQAAEARLLAKDRELYKGADFFSVTASSNEAQHILI